MSLGRHTVSEVKPEDWESLAQRLIAAMAIGIRIEQENGHRWIYEDPKADYCQFLFCPKNMVSETWIEKHYGSFSSALDLIDTKLAESTQPERSLTRRFRDINHFDDLGVVFGEGVQ